MFPRGQILVLLGAGLLLSAALWNGYPLTFWDTRAYVEHAGTLLPRPDRLIGYSLWIRALSWKVTLWPVAVMQCVLVAGLVLRTCGVLAKVSPVRYLGLLTFLTLSTALPWIAGQLMADVFTPALVIALFLLLEDEELSRWQRAALLALVALCACVHLTHVPLGMSLLAVWFLVLRRSQESRRALARVGVPALALLVGLTGIGTFNFARTGKLTLAEGGDAFVLAHLVESGIASRLLDAHCPARDYLLCPHRQHLPMGPDQLLWVDKLGLEPWKHTVEIKREAHRLLFDSLREQPALHLRVAVRYTLRTLTHFATGEGLDADALPLIDAQIARYAPRDLPGYRAAKQQDNAIPVLSLRALHTPIAWILLALGLAVVATASSLDGKGARFLWFVLAALFFNAALSGNLAGVYDRYQSRLMWLLALGVWGHLTVKWDTAAPRRLSAARARRGDVRPQRGQAAKQR